MIEKKPAPSNSRQKYSHMNFKDTFSSNSEFKVSIDRITIIADFLTEKFDRIARDEFLKKPFIIASGDGFKVIDNTATSVNDESNDDMVEQVAYINVPRFQQDKIRIDFNPNHSMETKAGRWLLNFIAHLETKHFTRCDVAFDVFNYDDTINYRIWNFGQSQTIYLDRNLKLETAYFGSPSSCKQVRMYNKLLEQKKKHKEVPINISSWWRLELQLRGKVIDNYPDEVKKMLSNFYYPEWQSIDNPSHKAIVYSMYNEPSIYANVSKSTQSRWRRIFKSSERHNELALVLAQLFVDNFNSLNYQLHSILNRFNVNV